MEKVIERLKSQMRSALDDARRVDFYSGLLHLEKWRRTNGQDAYFWDRAKAELTQLYKEGNLPITKPDDDLEEERWAADCDRL